MKYNPDTFLGNTIVKLSDDAISKVNEDQIKTIDLLESQGLLLEDVSCPLCSGDKKEIFLKTKDDMHLSMCTDCGLFYASRRPTKELLVVLSRYYLPSVITDIKIQQGQAKSKLEEFELELALVDQYNKKGMLLDVGAACGDFLFYAREEGWDCCGTELSTLCIQVATGIFKLPVFYGELHDLNIADKTFDAVTMRHVAEHFRDPLKEFVKAHTILKDNGLLLVTTPQFASNLENLKENHMLPLHIVDYTMKTIKLFLEKAKFEIIYFSAEDIGNMIILARKLTGDN